MHYDFDLYCEIIMSTSFAFIFHLSQLFINGFIFWFWWRLTHFRWVVPANGEVTLKLWFHSSVPGDFRQTLGFEVMGTKHCYQLYCRGICAFPSISKDHKWELLTNLKKRLLSCDQSTSNMLVYILLFILMVIFVFVYAKGWFLPTAKRSCRKRMAYRRHTSFAQACMTLGPYFVEEVERGASVFLLLWFRYQSLNIFTLPILYI